MGQEKDEGEEKGMLSCVCLTFTAETSFSRFSFV